MAGRTGLVVEKGAIGFVLLCLLLAWGEANAQPLRSSVTLRRNSITLRVFLENPRIPVGGVFLLKVQVTAPGDLTGTAVQYELPAFWADRVVQLSAISDRENFERGGRIWTRITYTHRLAPLLLGTIRFDGLRITALKERFEVPTIEGFVMSGGTVEPEQPPADPVKVQASIVPQKVFVGEQVVYTLRFSVLSTVDFVQNPTYEMPSTEGFWLEEFPQITRTFRSGYEMQLVRVALFPLREGVLRVGSATVTVRLQGFPAVDQLRTQPVQVQALPLPQPAPEGFQNLVGRVVATTLVSSNTVSVGETLQVQLRVEGTANLRNLEEAPSLSLPDAIVGLPRSRLRTREQEGRLWFVREFVWRVVPQKEGQITIPTFRIPYFNPSRKRYEVATTAPISIRVLPGIMPAARVESPSEVKSPPSPIMLILWSALALVGIVALTFGVRYWHQQRLLAMVPVADPQLRRTILALRKEGTPAFSHAVRNWLREQIYQRTGVLLSPNDTSERVQALLLEKGVSEAAARSISEVWERVSGSLGWEEALALLRHAAELPQRL